MFQVVRVPSEHKGNYRIADLAENTAKNELMVKAIFKALACALVLGFFGYAIGVDGLIFTHEADILGLERAIVAILCCPLVCLPVWPCARGKRMD